MNQTERTQEIAAAKAGVSPKTARKYLRAQKLPSELVKQHTWRTRADPFDDMWDWCRQQLEVNPGLQAKTLFSALQRTHPGRFQDGQLRTLQRRVKQWRATEGPGKEVFFDQVHRPGELCQSDFTHMTGLGVRINGQIFEHLVYHFVLTYSNWEWVMVCFSESFESLSEGVQGALWCLGGVPKSHRSDRMSAAVCRLVDAEAFTRRYQGLLDHYSLEGQKTQAGRANENGDVEQRHHRFKEAVDQALMLRGSRDFENRQAYEQFLVALVGQINAGRRERLQQELTVMRQLPPARMSSCKHLRGLRVSRGSLIYVDRNVYSVPSRLIGEKVDARLYADHVEVWYGQRQMDSLPRLRGRGKSRIHYPHLIEWLVRKPGAFENYRYRDQLFPTSRYRMAYDGLRSQSPSRSSKRYLRILQLASQHGERSVDDVLGQLIIQGIDIDEQAVTRLVCQNQTWSVTSDVTVDTVDLSAFDALYELSSSSEVLKEVSV